ncbi:hypothetical protein ACFVVX_31780 [Kitasatospora sp. NPDC058170]|uniref:hypothetical protein n=1 Tax=Kitasatospora sp. NPDC058170 TaxID=3346364 RepID=UPI0036DE1C86
MYVIRVHLETPSGRPPREPVAAPAVRHGLEHGLRGPARLSHARIRSTAGALDAVVFVAAGTLLEAEDGLRAACGELTGADGPLSGWRLLHCEADSWLALGLHELPTPN